MRRFYLIFGMAVALVALLLATFTMFTAQASAQPMGGPVAQVQTATPTPLACSYSAVTAMGTIVPGTFDIENHCDDCISLVQLPFAITFYGQQFAEAFVSSNGNLQFVSANPVSFNPCLPEPTFEMAIMPHWDDLLTDANPGCPGGGCGIYTNLTGAPPNRTFTIEWRAVLYSDPSQPVNFQVWFYEGQGRFDFVYGAVSRNGSDATIGVQKDETRYTEFSCMTASLSPGLAIQWTPQGCPTTPTSTATPCPGCTPSATAAIPSATMTRTPTTMPSATGTPCGFERVTGAITNQDLTQAGRLLRDEVRSLCEAPETCPGIEDSALRHYDSYTRTNDTGSTRCVTVGFSTMCQGTQFIFAAAYLDSFVPNNLCQNYLADIGASPYPHGYMSFEVPAGRSVVIVVSEVTTNQGCPEYTMTITGLGVCGTATPTVTGTPPTATRIPTATPTPCGYDFTTATATIVPGAQDIGNHCDDCVTHVTLPFQFRLYGQEYGAANVSSNGNIQFVTGSSNRINTCLPQPSLSASLLPNWTDLVTDCANCGIYTSVSGSAPNRIFNIEWRAGYFKFGGEANFEARLYEGTGVFDFIYGQMDDPGNNSTVGVQNAGATAFNQYSCNNGGLTPGLLVRGIPQVCGTVTPAATATRTATGTAILTATGTATQVATQTRTGTPVVGTSTSTSTSTSTIAPPNTATSTSVLPSPTSTPCPIIFTDVPPDSTFYTFIRCLACAGVVSGYSDGTFRPNNEVIRGQLSKIVSNAAGFSEDPNPQIFQDVPPGHAFYDWINRLTRRGVMTGYTCGGPGEPCVENRPYFRPFASATRGQTSKIVANAAQYVEEPSTQTFEDVPPTHTFYKEIERLATRQIMGGYQCGGPGEPCGPGNRAYFRPHNNVTRGQSAKIVANTFFPGCQP